MGKNAFIILTYGVIAYSFDGGYLPFLRERFGIRALMLVAPIPVTFPTSSVVDSDLSAISINRFLICLSSFINFASMRLLVTL